jgi:hypothetical protein
MTPETIDITLFGILLGSIVVTLMIACLLGIIIGTYFTVKWIYTDYHKSFKNNRRK